MTRNVATLIDPPQSRRPDVQPFSKEQAGKILDAVAGGRWEALYAVALTLGLRVGDLLGLRWQDVDLKSGNLQVRQQLQHLNGEKPMPKPLKTRASRRALDLPDDLVKRLRAHQDRQRVEQHMVGETWQDSGLVFPATLGTPMFSRNLTRQYKHMLEGAGLPERRIHDLLHTAACLTFARGLTAPDVKQVLGHSSIANTVDTYRHWLPESNQRAGAAMNDFLTRRQPHAG